jgi:D-alanyl-D-alanine carboxypeptidase
VIVTNGNGVAGDPDISMPGSNKGDLVVHDGTENTRFASGANGDLLIADSAQPTGLRWGPRRVGVSNGLSVANADWSAGDTATIALPGAAKGDLIVHNGSTNVRQPAGVDGQSIVYDSTQSAGIRADGLQHPNFAPANTSADNLPSSAVLMDAATGAILYGRDAKLGNWAASTTKTVSALLLAEYDTALDDTVTIDATDISSVPPGSSLCNVSAGQIYTTAELLKGILTPSGNDCTQAVARHVGNTYLGGGGTPIGGRTAFVARMNTRMAELAAELGTTRTSAFTNAYAGVVGTAITSSSSLDGHYISAYDLALTMRKIVLTQPTVLAQMAKGSDRMCTTTGSCIEHKGTSGNTSNVLCWAGALGAKGGSWTSPTFVSHMGAYERGTQKYIITLMNYPNTNQRSSDMLSLVEWAFRTNTTPATASCEEANSTIVTAGGFMDSSYNPTYSGGYSKFSNTLNDTIRIRWYGSQVQVYTVNRSANGNAAFRTDGDPETLVDTYRSVTAGNQLSYTSPLLPVGWHYTDMRVATATSGGTGAQLDRYVVTR